MMAMAHTPSDEAPLVVSHGTSSEPHPPLSTSQESHFPAEASPHSDLKLTMFRKIIASGCTIRSQQRGEQELAEFELCEVLDTILNKKPGTFLMRFGKYVDENDLKYFDRNFERDFEVSFRLKRLRKTLKRSSKSRMKTVKNRRYKCLKQLMEESDYFSEEEMRQRNPILFEHYIGQFMSEEEKCQMKERPTDMKLSSMILENMRVDQRTKLLEEQRTREADQGEEFDTSSEDESDTSEDEIVSLAPMKLSTDPETMEREKAMFSQEFLAAMQASFLNGNDKDFDYSKVDHDECYDSLDIEGKDAEDDYFDSEEPSCCEADGSDNGMDLGECGEVGGFESGSPVHEPSGSSFIGHEL